MTGPRTYSHPIYLQVHSKLELLHSKTTVGYSPHNRLDDACNRAAWLLRQDQRLSKIHYNIILNTHAGNDLPSVETLYTQYYSNTVNDNIIIFIHLGILSNEQLCSIFLYIPTHSSMYKYFSQPSLINIRRFKTKKKKTDKIS